VVVSLRKETHFVRSGLTTDCQVDTYSQPPNNQRRLSTRRVILNSVDGLAGQAGLLRNLSDPHRLLPQHGAHLVELIARVARLAANVGAVAMLLGILNTGIPALCAALVASACA
jgi:hypothetical protein